MQYEDETERKAGSKDYVIAHSAAIFLIGPSGKCIGFYRNNDLRDNRRMAEDLRHFMALPSEEKDDWESQKGAVVKPLPISGRQLYRGTMRFLPPRERSRHSWQISVAGRFRLGDWSS